MNLIKEFKKFALRGNVMDLAVGVVVGTAFGKIVSSLVEDIIMPPVGLLIAGVDFTKLRLVIKAAQIDPDGKIIREAVAIRYGNFLQVIFNFAIIAMAIFALTKFLTIIRRKQEEADAQIAKERTAEVKLLEEIRDLLKQNKY